MSKNPRNRWKSIKIASNDKKSLYVCGTIWGILMKFSGKMWIHKKKTGFHPLFRRYIFEKIKTGVKLTPTSSLFRVKKTFFYITSPAAPAEATEFKITKAASSRCSVKKVFLQADALWDRSALKVFKMSCTMILAG